MKKTLIRLRLWRNLLGKRPSWTSSWFNLIVTGLFIFFIGAQTVLAQYGLSETADTAKLPTGGTTQGIIGNVIGAGLTFVGVLFLVLMIYGGITWMMARGNEQQTKKALDTIIAAVIGLIIVLGSYALTTFVFSSVEDKSAGSSGSCVNIGGAACSGINCLGLPQRSCSTIDPCCEWQ